MSATSWNIEQIERFYADYAGKYDAEIEQDKGSYPAPAIISGWVIKNLNLKETVEHKFRVLDLGCGTGKSSEPLFAKNIALRFEVYGVDTTREVCLFVVSVDIKSRNRCWTVRVDSRLQNS